jgi:hypothetical protein
VGIAHLRVEELMACGSTWIVGGRGFMKGLMI